MEVNGILVAASELKEPMVAMRQLALSLELARDVATKKTLTEAIIKNAERGILQINDLMQIPRLNLENFPLETVSLRAVCDDALNDLTKIDMRPSEDFSVNVSSKVNLAVANAFLLRRVICNFCINAMPYVKYGNRSGLFIEGRGDLVRVRVRDHGPAVSDEIVQKIAQGFMDEPVKEALKPEFSGLLLMIAADFALNMKSQVRVMRHMDGTSFYVDLPVSRQMSLFGEGV